MRNKFYVLILGALLTLPCVLCAEEVEIPLTVMGQANLMPCDDPLDGPTQSPDIPPRPRDFHATIDNHDLTVRKMNNSIPTAHVIVVNAATGAIVLNRNIITSFTEYIANSGVYIIYIQCIQGTWEGQFIVQ